MSTAKDKIVEIVQSQPDDSSYEEIVRELAFNAMIERGIKDSDAGNTISEEELEHRIKQW